MSEYACASECACVALELQGACVCIDVPHLPCCGPLFSFFFLFLQLLLESGPCKGYVPLASAVKLYVDLTYLDASGDVIGNLKRPLQRLDYVRDDDLEIREGWLSKKGAIKRAWKTRYARLSPTKLAYYKKPTVSVPCVLVCVCVCECVKVCPNFLTPFLYCTVLLLRSISVEATARCDQSKCDHATGRGRTSPTRTGDLGTGPGLLYCSQNR
jgi:PH domain